MRRLIIICLALYLSAKLSITFFKRYYDRVKYISDIKSILHRKYDFIVVGSGTSGSCVAGVLARAKEIKNGRRPRVLLLEAGERDSYHPFSSEVIPVMMRVLRGSKSDWKYKTVSHSNCMFGLKNNQSKCPRGKICGGCSIMNYMVYVRGHPFDYNQWADEYGCGSQWSYDSLIPYFQELENCIFNFKYDSDRNVRGINGLQTISKRNDAKQNAISQLFIKAAVEVGYSFVDDYNAGDNTGVSFTQYTIDKNGRRLTSFRSFIATLFNDEHNSCNIDIVPNAMVSKIIVSENINNEDEKNDEYNKAIGVVIDGKYRVYIDTNGEVIVCGGSINSPQLLMLSGIGDKQHLMQHNIQCIADLPGVGQNLRDHFLAGFHLHWNADKIKQLYPYFDGVLSPVMSPLKEFYKYLRYGTGKFTTGILDAHLFTQSTIAKKHNWPFNDLQLVSATASVGHPYDDKRIAVTLERLLNVDCSKWNERDFGQQYREKNTENAINFNNTSLGLVMNVRPQSVGELLLKSNDFRDPPSINPKYLSNKEDKIAFMDGCSQIRKIFESETFMAVDGKLFNFPELGDGSFEAYMDVLLDQRLQTIFHPIGTCKMGNTASDKYVVCDGRLKVRTFCNLRVCDASVMPNLIGGNTQAPCYVIGVKGAHMFLEDWMKRVK